MPDVTITAPVAADSIDRLTLGASDARVLSRGPGDGVEYAGVSDALSGYNVWSPSCMAEE